MPVIYISYGPTDGTMARLLAADLRTLGAQVALEAADVRFAPTRARVLAGPVRRSAIMIVILSPAAVASDLVTAEWRYALDHDIPLILLLHHPTDIPNRLRRLPIIDCDSEQYPAALEDLHDRLSAYGIMLEPVAILTAHYKAEWLATMKSMRDARSKHTPHNRRLVGVGGALIVVCFFLLVAFFTNVMDHTPPRDNQNPLITIDFALAQGLGWNRIFLELFLLIVGGVLIARRFGSRTRLHISIARTAGAFILLLAGTVVLHADEANRVELPESTAAQLAGDDLLREQSHTLALDEGGGGGWLGHQLYMLLRFTLAPAGMTILLFIGWVLGVMLFTGVSPRRVADYLKARRRKALERRARSKTRYRQVVNVAAPTLPRKRESAPDDTVDAAADADSADARN